MRHPQGTAVTFAPVAGEPLSTQYAVSVNGRNAPVYTARLDANYHREFGGLILDDTYSFAGFDCDGPVEMVIESAVPLTELSIRAVGRQVSAKLDGSRATFTLDRHGTYLIERNGNGNALTADYPNLQVGAHTRDIRFIAE